MADKFIVNTAHPPGKTCIAFSKDGKFVYTGGCDSLVRLWRADTGADQEPDAALDANDNITSLAVDNDGWLSGCEDAHVRRYSKRSVEMESLIFEANSPILCVAPDPKGRRVAITTDEAIVRIVDLDDTSKVKILDKHTKCVRKASWHPSGALLTTCGADGLIIGWDMSEDEPKVEKVIEGVLPETEANDYASDCTALWHTSGHYFIVSNRENQIVCISRNTWEQSGTFTDDACSGAFTSLTLSVNGVYLAAACASGIFVWSTASRRALVTNLSDVTIHQLGFSPSRNLLAWTDSEGTLTRWPDVIPANFPDPVKLAASSNNPAPIAKKRQATPLFGDDDDERKAAEKGAGNDIDLDEGLQDIDDDWIIDDVGGGMQDNAETSKHGAREFVSVTKAQPAFQPGSTPFANKRRYLSFNSTGVVEVSDQDTHQIINVEFHDQTTRKNYHFIDHDKIEFASVGERGVVYASPPDKERPARVTYKPYSTWSAQDQWSYSMPSDERVVAVAAGGSPAKKSLRLRADADFEGNGYVAVATDRGWIRFFSGSGMQMGPIWAVDGDVVAMVAGRDYLFIVHREGGTSLDGNQNLKYTLRTAESFRVLHTGRVPVNKGQTLKWIGISDEGTPVIYDSAERVMMLEHYRFTAQGSWVVLLDATKLARRKGKDESYWPIGVNKSTLLCLILKGRQEYPGFPRQLTQDVEMNLPYLDMDAPEAQKEESFARNSIMLDLVRDSLDDDMLDNQDILETEKELDKELIVLIQLACKHDRLQRALDIAKLLHLTKSFDAACAIAKFYHLAGLEEKFMALKEDREENDRYSEDKERRRGWRDASGPVYPSRDYSRGLFAAPQARPFQNAQPAPPVNRKGLTTATPSSDPPVFRRNPMQAVARSETPDAEPQRTPEGKRKRDSAEPEYDDEYSQPEVSNKRHAPGEGSEQPFGKPLQQQSKPNPFAKKPAENGKANPFLKKAAASKPIQKSESFFQKVDEAETARGKKKDKKGKTPSQATNQTKQTTLFGLPAVPTAAKKSKTSKNTPEPTQETQIESQATISDVSMEPVDDSGEPVRGTQVLVQGTQERQENEVQPEPYGETQEDTQVDSQVEPLKTIEDEGEDVIDWPPSRPPSPPPADSAIAVGADSRH